MTTVRKAGFVLSVDVEKTREYYSTHTLCECVCCRNYFAQISEKCPELTAFLSEFGVDAARPDETFFVDSPDRVDYLCVDYTVCGKVEKMGDGAIGTGGGLTVHIVDGFCCPNEQTGDYFTISTDKITLGWEIDKKERRRGSQAPTGTVKALADAVKAPAASGSASLNAPETPSDEKSKKKWLKSLFEKRF